MFRARKSVEVPSKRSTGLLSPRAEDLLGVKRQRLEVAPYMAPSPASALAPPPAPTASRLLVDSPACAIEVAAALPAFVAEELRREWPAMRRRQYAQPPVVACRAMGSSWYAFVVRTRLLLWEPTQGRVVTLPLPDELAADEVLHPFLLSPYAPSLSLLVVGRSGSVLFWEDIERPYDGAPLSVQIPLQPGERVVSHADALLNSGASNPDDLAGVVCWSNQGSVWEVAMDDRRLRVRAFEKQNAGFLSGITKSVTQFFFSGSTRAGAGAFEGDPHQPIKYAKVVPSESGDGGADTADSDVESLVDSETADLVVLFESGIVERRQFNTGDVLDCSYVSRWHFDASRVAIGYFSDNFPNFHLAKIAVVALPYVNETCLSLLVAFVCASKDDSTAKVKYVLFQFALDSLDDGPPEPEWACVLDYEPVFTEDGDASVTAARFFQVESFGITRDALYLVWTAASPIQFSTILLPQRGRRSSVRSAAFSLQGVQNQQLTYAFGARVDDSSNASHGQSTNSVKGSVSFLLMETDLKALSGSLCVATASNMQSVERVAQQPSPGRGNRARLAENRRILSNQPSHHLSENLDVEEYVGLLLEQFQHDPQSTTALRVASRDIRTVAQASVALDMQILDAQPSSGLRWDQSATSEDGMSSMSGADSATVTPKLVKYQLEEKRSRHVEFARFLQRRCPSVWTFIENSTDLKRCMLENEEKLRAAIALSKLQASILSRKQTAVDAGVATEAERIQQRLTGQFLLHAIEVTVEHRGYQKEQLQLAGYNAFDVFYCEVSKLPELFQLLDQELDKLATSISDSSPAYLHALLESGYSMLCMIRLPPADDKQVFAPTGSWAFTRQVREVVVNHIVRLTQQLGYTTSSSAEKQVQWPANDVFEVADQIQSLGVVLLDSYMRFLPTSRREEAEDLRRELDVAKRAVLNPLVFVATSESESAEPLSLGRSSVNVIEQTHAVERQRSDLFKTCVRLSETYSYYEGMVFLAFTEDRGNLEKLDYVLGKAAKSAALKRFEAYCSKFDAFDAFVYRWYTGEITNPWASDDIDQQSDGSSMLAYLLANSALFGASLHEFVKEHDQLAKYRWMTAVAVERFDEAATLALREAEAEQWSLTDRKTMSSIAKIAALAGPGVDSETTERIDREVSRLCC